MDDAIAVSEAGVMKSEERVPAGTDVRLALRTLRFIGVPPANCRFFWDGRGAKNAIWRDQSMNAVLNRIKLAGKGAKS